MYARLTIPWSYVAICVSATLLCLMSLGTVSLANPVREDNCPIAEDLQIRTYKWSNQDVKPNGIVVMLHGLIMHGGTFNELARNLAGVGYLVYALDMRGYGRWYQEPGNQKVDYARSQKDLQSLARRLRLEYQGLPIFYLGESLGAGMAIRLAATCPQTVDGLVLSSPALKSCSMMRPRMLTDMLRSAVNPCRQIDLVPYIRKCASHDPRIIDEIVNDPMVRKELSARELFCSKKEMRATLPYIRRISPNTPVLVFQGRKDRTVKANAVVLLLERLRSLDQTVRWLPQHGHILIETAYLEPETLQTISGWLQQHTPTISTIHSAQGESNRKWSTN